jgi:hypothetical protein
MVEGKDTTVPPYETILNEAWRNSVLGLRQEIIPRERRGNPVFPLPCNREESRDRAVC